MDAASSVAEYWYFHIPNFILAVFMYTLLGRVLLSLVVDEDSENYIWRFFCRLTSPIVAVVAVVTPIAVAPLVLWLFAITWLFWLRMLLYFGFALGGIAPKLG